jgi:predicted CoA-binding protein
VAAINKRIDVIDVFRKSEDIPAVIDDVLKNYGIKVF